MEDDHDRLWKAIRGSPFWSVYLRELYWLAKQVSSDIERVFEEAVAGMAPGSSYVKVDPALHARIVGVVFAAGRLRALVRDREFRDRKSQERRELVRRRSRALRELLSGIELSAIMDGETRDSLEHIDEYFDRVAADSYRGTIGRPTIFAVDMVVSSRRELERLNVRGEKATLGLIRVYIVEERVVVNCGRELRLDAIRGCCTEIWRRVEEHIPEFARDDRGASFVVITDKSFET